MESGKLKCCGSKTCDKRGILQSVENFNKNSAEKDGYYCYCRLCQKRLKNLKYKEGKTVTTKNKRLLHYYLKQKSDKCKENKESFFPSLLPANVSSLSPNQITSLHLKNIEEYIKSITPSCCPYTGLEIKLYPYKAVKERQKEDWFRKPDKLSIDRIDSLSGYEVGNVEVVSWFWNCLKNHHSKEEVINLVIKTGRYLESKLKG